MTNPHHTVTLGQTVFRSRSYDVILKAPDRLHHVYAVGKTGTGKSTLFQNMALQDMLAGQGICFVDPHGEAIDWLLARIPPERLEDVVLFDPSDDAWPLGLNLLEAHSEAEKDFLVAEAIQIFYKLFDPGSTGIVGPQFEHWMRNAALTVMADPAGGSLIDIPRLFTDKEFEIEKRRHVTDKIVTAFWEQQMAKTSDFHRSEMLNYFTSKFGRFMGSSLMRHIIGQRESAINISSIMDEGKILLVNLAKGKIGETNAHMLGLILMAKLQAATLRRANVPSTERRPFYLFVDEFQNVMTDSFISMLSEVRKYGLAVHVTHQYIEQLPDAMRAAVLGNAGTLVSFQVGAADAKALLNEFEPQDQRKTQELKEEDFQYLPRHHFLIRLMLDGITHPPFSGQSQKPLSVASAMNPGLVRDFSRLTYGQPKQIIQTQL
ncbi:MAG: ATP-binding protein [Candidatus Portnoybacteria bacterium]|nr:ATP-binding protein [Candidatus Portnoybacteria bacterium]